MLCKMTAAMADISILTSKIGAAAGLLSEVRVAFAFGSQIAGTAWAQSDLDIAVRWTRELDDEQRADARLRLIAALTDVLGALGERADIVDLDRADAGVAFRAIREGVCVHAALDAERVRAVVDASRRYDDDGPRRALFRRAAVACCQRMKGTANG